MWISMSKGSNQTPRSLQKAFEGRASVSLTGLVSLVALPVVLLRYPLNRRFRGNFRGLGDATLNCAVFCSPQLFFGSCLRL
jgi:hypothetical protein